MTRTDIINSLISKYNFKSYLEIGLGDGQNYNNVVCLHKTNVDPSPECYRTDACHKMTSDEFFSKSKKSMILFLWMVCTFSNKLTLI